MGWLHIPGKCYFCSQFQAFLAQLVEQLTRNEQVAGSSPVEGSAISPGFKGLFYGGFSTKKAKKNQDIVALIPFPAHLCTYCEVSSGFEPLYTVLQTAA